ncbi:MAG: dihydroorotate dehydrogenase electron transfer subunit [Dehalococcoidales bacterium]|nr:dihydroorotate dehydrogenase electron transfer subunit [Dehalococcoidales bacterium]MDP7309956.1 dihydroorotate dehydrogenase electron transfer subunit [Dehalococcoidales bacterium]MDP7409829.1 dihydroorotate dehydrogenase electron transfer subunit [Dehalococcoidales bacterium]MDP7676267.1 dihydroorotate dehydrogenase electron transfer subunit [Dehalococcoidales bacterium]HJM36941.1 dihydroorotate dehydrogenase electron transfer subunit [Dehalococcoidales bacterium]
MKQIIAKVISNTRILKELERRRDLKRPQPRDVLGSYLLWLDCPELTPKAKPGQFVMVRCGGKTILPRPFSIHQVNNKGNIALFFAVWEDGKGTNWLSQRRIGAKVELFGPLGVDFSIRSDSRNLLLVAGGIGIAPLYFLAQEAVKKTRSVTLLLGAATASQIYPKNLLPSRIKTVITTEDGSAGKKGRVIDLVPEFIDRVDQVFACGPILMYREMYLQRRKCLKNKPTQVSLETVMGCGRGVCYGCTIKTKKGLQEICRDGPIFDLDDIM